MTCNDVLVDCVVSAQIQYNSAAQTTALCLLGDLLLVLLSRCNPVFSPQQLLLLLLLLQGAVAAAAVVCSCLANCHVHSVRALLMTLSLLSGHRHCL